LDLVTSKFTLEEIEKLPADKRRKNGTSKLPPPPFGVDTRWTPTPKSPCPY